MTLSQFQGLVQVYPTRNPFAAAETVSDDKFFFNRIFYFPDQFNGELPSFFGRPAVVIGPPVEIG